MNIHSPLPTTPDEFLDWNEGREGKREFVRGRVVEMMINVTKRHAFLAMRLGAFLLQRFPYPEFTVGSADVAVRCPTGIRYPDVFVDQGESTSSDTGLVAERPVILVEILSPSSYGRDFVEKVADYQAIPSLLHYLILSHEEPRVWLWSREADGSWTGPLENEGADTSVALARLGINIPLAEIYAGISRR